MTKEENRSITRTVLIIVGLLIGLQGIILGVKVLVFNSLEETLFSRSMVTMATMVVLFVALVIFCRHKGWALRVFPERFGPLYYIITALALAFYGITLVLVNKMSFEGAIMLFYGSLVTPVFEEVLFRGVIWDRLNFAISKEWKTYLLVTVLFALWHIGYAAGIYLWTGGNLFNCILMKVMVGGAYGVIIGAVRYKTKNCYLGILLHGVLNAFG